MSKQPTTIHLSDYKRPTHWIDHTDLEFDITADFTLVKSRMKILRNKEYSEFQTLCLDGDTLELQSIKINEENLSATSYKVTDKELRVDCDKDEFILETVVKIYPEKNFSCEGLYQSGHIYCTQNEAEGFRKITYYLDRPDVMSKFRTKIIADKKRFPFLLSNGNPIQKGELDGGRHFTVWEDPFPKPCYLFALVTGDLGVVKDTYLTKSGRTVALEIYVDKGNEDKCDHAMRSLQNSMQWDEEKFGLEYDLDIYMVVAVDTFNMGAMENKGLNIFNSAYVLANPETATDENFQGIEAVIGHEYFHNWTGNRVTCRDWFQLTLKEGLTVYRDQEFSSDMLSRPVKRIEDVRRLRQMQFTEDAGPMSHPIKPKSYIEINNFYTATVYEKGAEVIRMIHTLIGDTNFRKGMDLYFERHDGQAVTTEDFVHAMSDASGVNLEHFKVWYDQNGTPKVHIKTKYDPNAKKFDITLTQDVTTNNKNYNCLHMPWHFGLLLADGQEVTLPNNGKFELRERETRISLENITSKPTPSWNRNFATPVRVVYDYTDEELIHLMTYDKDPFNRFDATQTLFKNTISKLRSDLGNGGELKLSSDLLGGFKKLLQDKSLDEAFLSLAITVPSLSELLQEESVYEFEKTNLARNFLKEHLALDNREIFQTRFNQLSTVDPTDLTGASMGKRMLRNTCLGFLSALGTDESYTIIKKYFESAKNMTEELAGLQLLIKDFYDKSHFAVEKFYKKWKHETLVMQKWISAQVVAPRADILKTVHNLEKVDVYDPKVPNLLRSLVGTFANANPMMFNAPDGSGYEFLANRIAEVDKFNPQMASRLAKTMGHYKRLDNNRASLLKKQVERLFNMELSKDTFEVLSKSLK